MKTGHFECGIAQGEAKAALLRDEPTQREPVTFHRLAGGQRLVGTQDRPRTGCPPAPVSKPAIPPAGFTDVSNANPAMVPAGGLAHGHRAGRTSQCGPWAAVIEQSLLAGLSAQRIYQDLVAAHGFTGAYDAVKRFVRRLTLKTELPFRRMECAPGAELQVDFGQGAWVVENGRRRRPHLFRAV